MARLSGRVAIVRQRASRGIGRSVARLLASEGASGGGQRPRSGGRRFRQDSGPAHDVVAELGEASRKAIASGADIADFTAAEDLVETAIEEFGDSTFSSTWPASCVTGWSST